MLGQKVAFLIGRREPGFTIAPQGGTHIQVGVFLDEVDLVEFFECQVLDAQCLEIGMPELTTLVRCRCIGCECLLEPGNELRGPFGSQQIDGLESAQYAGDPAPGIQ